MKHFHTWSRGRRLAAGTLVAAAALATVQWKLVARAAGPEGAPAGSPPATAPAAPAGSPAGAVADGRGGQARKEGEDVPTVRGIGTIKERTMEVKARIDGVVQAVSVREGQAVKAGDLLCQLDDRAARIALDEAEAELELKALAAKRTEGIYQDKITTGKTNSEIDQARADVKLAQIRVEARKLDLLATRVTAPFAGVVSECQSQAGDVVSRGAPLFLMVESGAPKVRTEVPAEFAARVRPGSKVHVRVRALKDRTYDGEVFFISPEVNPGKGTVEVKATVTKPDAGLRPGMFVDVTVDLEARAEKTGAPKP